MVHKLKSSVCFRSSIRAICGIQEVNEKMAINAMMDSITTSSILSPKEKGGGPGVWDCTLQMAQGSPFAFAITAHPDFNRLLIYHLAVSRGVVLPILHTLTSPIRLIQSRSSSAVLSCGLIFTYGEHLFNLMCKEGDF